MPTPSEDPTPRDEPVPAPSEDPTPSEEPTPTGEPTPSEEPTPTGPPCPDLTPTPLGARAHASGAFTVEGRATACFTFTVESPGLYQMLTAGQSVNPALYSGEDRVDCEDQYYRYTWCGLAAGTYTLQLFNSDWSARQDLVSMVPLTAAPGCPVMPGTAYGSVPATGEGHGRTGVVCRSFTASAGDRITLDAQLGGYEPASWITDGTGKRICPVHNEDGSDGCVLPEGTDGYRVLAIVPDADGGAASPYTIKVRRLSDPVGCAPVTVTAYGAAPAAAAPGTGCRTFTPTTTGRYDVAGLGPDTNAGGIKVFAANGTTACRDGQNCALTAGVPYTLVTDKAVRILDRASAEGCAGDVTLAATYRGTFDARGAVDCLRLPVPQGAHIAVLTDRAAEFTVLDATGTALCSDSLIMGPCELSGTAPYRLLASKAYEDAPSDAYRLVVHRTDTPSACRTFEAGDFTTNPKRMAVRTGGGTFADCLAIPATGHSARELTQIQKISGTPGAEVRVLDTSGKRVCSISTYSSTWTTCELTPGLAHTVLIQGQDQPAEFALTRRDVTTTARGCVTTPAVAVGGPSTGGVPAKPGTFLCHQVTTADERDTLHLNARDARSSARFAVYDATGVALCGYFTNGCAVTGSKRYQVLVVVREGETAAPAYRLDALRIGTATGPAPECVKVPNVSYGFGPLTGTLSEQKTALCAVLPTATRDSFDLKLSPTGTPAQLPTPKLYHSSPLKDGCNQTFGPDGYAYTCGLPTEDFERVARTSTLVVGLPETPAQATTAVRVEGRCASDLCGPEEWTVGSVGPAAVANGKITMKVTGTALHEGDQLFLMKSGSDYRALSTATTVAPDRRSMTVSVDLTNAPPGELLTRVYTRYSRSRDTNAVSVVAALRNTAAPTFSGSSAVGSTVTAKPGSWSLPVDSLSYQWRANGVAIAGATASTYTISSAVRGKQLSVAVIARKAGHPTLTSVSTAALVNAGVAPKPTRVPYVSGVTRVGSKLTAVVGTWAPAPTSYAYQWRADGVAISGATGATYTPVAALRNKKLTVTVTAHRTGHLSGSHTTAGYTVASGLAPKATGAPALTGTVKVGRTLTLNRGSWTPAPTSYAYQWYANGRAISGATRAAFTLTKAQRGTKITVRVTAHRTGHVSGVAWTRATGAVAG
ncbi:hypothetical protein ACFQ64_25960 [Streptomyces sp. NPDC056460]|uniref:hypothetical protein n=1 Tax=Streptomyces sp. NPDC056460 TaxID=3345825 RepID=UPI0036C8D874